VYVVAAEAVLARASAVMAMRMRRLMTRPGSLPGLRVSGGT
jgi:hypothetical protein